MLAANPNLPAWRVKELMIETCEDLGEKAGLGDFGIALDPSAEAAKVRRTGLAPGP